ncbi:glycogen synthase [Salmonella enterica subsp. enterica]|nr:glycogen synthase [Salmonella enterica subsp. enterica]
MTSIHLNNFDFLARSFAGNAGGEGRPVDIRGGNRQYGREHRDWFRKRYALYCQRARAKRLEGEHNLAPFTGAGHYSELI